MIRILLGELRTPRIVGVGSGLILGIGQREQLSTGPVGKARDGADAVGVDLRRPRASKAMVVNLVLASVCLVALPARS